MVTVASDDVLIRLRDVSFHYTADRPVLTGVDFDLRRGDRVGLVGPNGGGKTTLLYLLVGLVHPVAGTVEVFGRDRRTERDFLEVRPRVGFVFQDPEDQLFCPTVAEDVAFGPLNLGKTQEEAMAIVRATLARLELADLAERITYRLSFGQKKLVSIATALAMQPEVLLLDEPDAGLDVHHTDRVVEVLSALQESVFVVSHHRTFLERFCHRIVVLRDGAIQDDSSQDAT